MMMASSFLPTKKVKGENSTVPNWLELPRDITANILQRLNIIEIVASACVVCPLWWNICKDPLMWRTIRMSDNVFYHSDYKLVEICRYAIERSCGHIEFISVECFGTDDLLKLIAENASKLTCLGFVSCRRITDNRFCEAVRKLPLLEKLNISLCNLSKDSLEVVGKSCKLLNYLAFVRNGIQYRGFDDGVRNNDDEAFIIAKTMPGLQYLNIRGNKVTNVGLIAILDGCPLLETLDIRRCYNLDLNGSLKKRCIEQIKDLKVPEIRYEDDDDGYQYGGDDFEESYDKDDGEY